MTRVRYESRLLGYSQVFNITDCDLVIVVGFCVSIRSGSPFYSSTSPNLDKILYRTCGHIKETVVDKSKPPDI